eukprot:scaffold9673_cov112-Isochrysis_galbana.AAC.4
MFRIAHWAPPSVQRRHIAQLKKLLPPCPSHPPSADAGPVDQLSLLIPGPPRRRARFAPRRVARPAHLALRIQSRALRANVGALPLPCTDRRCAAPGRPSRSNRARRVPKLLAGQGSATRLPGARAQGAAGKLRLAPPAEAEGLGSVGTPRRGGSNRARLDGRKVGRAAQPAEDKG